MPTVEIDTDFEDSNDNDYKYTEDEDVHDDSDYVPDEDTLHLSHVWWELDEVSVSEPWQY
eukprot:13171401-Ditylum_brightwellii.AAC.2